MASKGKSNHPKRIEDIKELRNLSPSLHGIVGHMWKPPLSYGHHPNEGAISDGRDGSDERNPRYGVEVRELRKGHRSAGEDEEPLHRRQWLGRARRATDDLVEHLRRRTPQYNQRYACSSGQVQYWET